MTEEQNKLKGIAARLVAEGLRRAAALTVEARRDRSLADMMERGDAETLRFQAFLKWQRAARIQQLCGRLAAAHGIGPKETGRGLRPRPAGGPRIVTIWTAADERRIAR